MTTTETNLGQQLRAARKMAGLTQELAAAHLNVTRTTLVAIEAGARNVRATELAILCALYGCDITALDPDWHEAKPREESMRSRVAKRVASHKPDMLMLYTLEALQLTDSEAERMAATLLHLLIAREQREEAV